MTWAAEDAAFGTVRYLGLFDRNVGGHLLYAAPVTSSTLLAGDTLSVTLRLDGLGGADNYVQIYDLLEQHRRQVTALTTSISV